MSINTFVKKAIENSLADVSQGAKYFERPAGSNIPWIKGQADEGAQAAAILRELARDNMWTEVTEQAVAMGASFGACRYFQFTNNTPYYIEAVSLIEELTEEELTQVKIVKGHHGYELQAPVTSRPTNLLTICVGNGTDPFTPADADNIRVFFWAPGRITPNVQLGKATVKLA